MAFLSATMRCVCRCIIITVIFFFVGRINTLIIIADDVGVTANKMTNIPNNVEPSATKLFKIDTH